MRRAWLLGLLLTGAPNLAAPDAARIAVATNFVEVTAALVERFEARSGVEVTVTAGSTGKLYAQITHGAPFHAFLAADAERPRLLLDSGWAVPGSDRTYAYGRLVLWSADAGRIDADGAATLQALGFRRLAMANPRLAPYGRAAQEVLDGMGLTARLDGRIVLGENIGQAHALVATGNAELGFVALSQLTAARGGSRWIVPEELHAPIRQDAVLLKAGATNQVARDFLGYLESVDARRIIERYGYRT